ncbi:MAG: hypothetical protein GY869_14745 [Planctomycetes bacterium]|nr:hypothetical protein [Planctomycetota bacterium]
MDHSKRARSRKPPTQPREEAYVNSTNMQNALQRIRQAVSWDEELRFICI